MSFLDEDEGTEWSVPDTRYMGLRLAVAWLAAPAEAQQAYPGQGYMAAFGLTRILGSAALALELEYAVKALDDMLAYGEISQAEADAVRSLDDWLKQWRDDPEADLWQPEALFTDPRWEEIRQRAAGVLAELPDERRESAYTRAREDERKRAWDRDRSQRKQEVCRRCLITALFAAAALNLLNPPVWLSALALAAGLVCLLPIMLSGTRREGRNG